MVEAADTIDDLLVNGNSRTIVGKRSFGTYDSEGFALPETAGAIALTVWGNCGGNDVRLNEWNLFGHNPACGQGVDLSRARHTPSARCRQRGRLVTGTSGRIRTAVPRSLLRTGPRCGSKANSRPGSRSSFPSPLPPRSGSAGKLSTVRLSAGEDYLQSTGVLTFPPGVASQIHLDTSGDGRIGEGDEDFSSL